jgi:hypothetical protein
LDLAKAPFRLIAIVNRMDLRTALGTSPVGEGRLVYGMTAGPADDPTNAAMTGTLIFEYNLPTTMTLKQWAQIWHGLAAHATYDDSYKSALQTVTELFVKRGAAPDRQNGSALGQVRTNESVMFWIWQLRQFQIADDGQMHLHTTRNTPAASFNGSSALLQYIQANSAAIMADQYQIPDTMLGGSADEFAYRWSFAGLDEVTRAAYAKGTCNGCHSEGENPSLDKAFHVSPLQSGVAKFSPFMNNASDPTHDELARRASLAQTALCGH